MTSRLLVRNARAGFTLIELLVVIAIIAILAGILFPVAATVQESARRGATMSNLQKIHQAISAYELDNREYPEFLFGPAICKANGLPDPTCSDFYSMKETATLVTGRYRSTDPEYQAARNARRIFSKSLYPEYIRDLETFKSGNNVLGSVTWGEIQRFSSTLGRIIGILLWTSPTREFEALDCGSETERDFLHCYEGRPESEVPWEYGICARQDYTE